MKVQLWHVIRQVRVLSFIAALVASSFIYIGYMTYVSFLIIDKGGDAAFTGMIIALASVVLAATSTQSGRIVAIVGNRTYPLIIAITLQAIGIILIAFTPLLSLVVVASIVLGLGNGLIYPLFRSIITDISPDNIRGTIVSIVESLGRLGTALGPALMGGTIAVLRDDVGRSTAIELTVILFTSGFSILSIIFLLFAIWAPPIEAIDSHKKRNVL